MEILAKVLFLGSLAGAMQAQTVSGLCMVSAAENTTKHAGGVELMLRSSDCGAGVGEGHCSSSNNSDLLWSRLTGVSAGTLKQEGAQLNARMTGDAGELSCSGTVHDGVLAGHYVFTPNAAFTQRLAAMGFQGVEGRKSEAFLMLDISMAWVEQIKDAGVAELSTEQLINLKALGVDQTYIRGMTAAGYPDLHANKLVEMKAVGVTPEMAADAKSIGFHPTEQELVQMSIFKIDRPFVERMRARGMRDLTLESLIKIKIFKLDD